MAFDPLQEDFARLTLSRQTSSSQKSPYEQIRQVSAMTQQFFWGNDALATTDEDRAFHLMAQAAHVIDAKLPFAAMDEGAVLAEEAHSLLEEAIALDPLCFDAQRILHAQSAPSLETHVRYLTDGLSEVERTCKKRAREAQKRQESACVPSKEAPFLRDLAATDSSALSSLEERTDQATFLEMAPYQRWLQSLAELSLISGRYTKTLEYAKICLALDPRDPADARLTAVLAYAKLQDAPGLSKFLSEIRSQLAEPQRGDAWLALAELALAWQSNGLDTARGWVGWLLQNYPMAATTLHEQVEFPEPMFARLNAQPRSEDELMIAVSEAAVLFQEGADESGKGPLGRFVAGDSRVKAAYKHEKKFFEHSGEGSQTQESSSQDADHH